MDIRTKTVDLDITALGDDGPGTFTGFLSTDALDRDGETLTPDTWMPLPNRITVDSDHGMSTAALVGSAVPKMLPDGRIEVQGTFANTAHAQEIRMLAGGKGGERHLDTLSVAYRTVKKSDGTEMREMLNGSFVVIPANPECVLTGVKSANKSFLMGAFLKSLKENGQMPAPEEMLQAIHDAAAHLGAECMEMDDGEDDTEDPTEDAAETKSAGPYVKFRPLSGTADSKNLSPAPEASDVGAAAAPTTDDHSADQVTARVRALAFLTAKSLEAADLL